jgi:hypothetical protein
MDLTLKTCMGCPIRGELRSQDDLVAVLTGRHPFADPFLGFLVLIVAGGVDEISALGEEEVEDREGGVLVTFAHKWLPK